MKRTLLLLFLINVCWVYQSRAEGVRYQFEVFVFEQGVSSNTKSGQADSQIHWPSALTELSSFQQNDNKALKAGADALLAKPDYRQIVHYAWTQSMGPGNAILPMHIQSEDGRLDGYIHLKNAQPFDLILDFELSANAAKANSGKSPRFHLQEKRPIELNKIQYFDHPKFGVMIVVNAL